MFYTLLTDENQGFVQYTFQKLIIKVIYYLYLIFKDINIKLQFFSFLLNYIQILHITTTILVSLLVIDIINWFKIVQTERVFI